jgi:hypothetical protein
MVKDVVRPLGFGKEFFVLTPVPSGFRHGPYGMIGKCCTHARPRGRTRLRGYALEKMIFREFDELKHLVALDRRKAFEEILNCQIAFQVVDQGVHRDAGTFETRFPAHPLGIRLDNPIQQGMLFRCHVPIVAGGSIVARGEHARRNMRVMGRIVRADGKFY